MILQSTPVLIVQDIEASEHFFAKLGFKRTVEVPHRDGLGFVIMTQEGEGGGDAGLGVMLETAAAAADDSGLPPETFKSGAHLFMSVADLGQAERALHEFEQFMPRRNTFYGATEIGWREPGGNYITVAQFAANSPDEA